MDWDLHAHTHLLVIGGSRAYGLHTPESDVDLKGAAIAPRAQVVGLHAPWEQADAEDEMEPFFTLLTDEEKAASQRTKLEGSVYDLRKLCRLAADCNPNILEALFCRDAEIRLLTPIGQALRDHRDRFLSQRARSSFGGYAAGQLKRIRGHRRWLLHPPTRAPTRGEFDLPETTLLPADQLGAAEAAIRQKMDHWEIDFSGLPPSEIIRVQDSIAQSLAEQGVTADRNWTGAARAIGIDDNLMELLDREKKYRTARTEWSQYRQWKKARNPDRAALEANHGYDTKHAAHLLRLLRMGREVLLEGTLHVWRQGIDADELQEVRAGALTYDQLLEKADALNAELDQILRDKRAVVPPKPDLAALDAAVTEWMWRGLVPT